MIADVYLHAEATGVEVQILSHDIDVDGVDMTLIHESSVVPLQLKSVTHGARTGRWSVRRRIPFPTNYTRLAEAILRPDGPATEGQGGALVVQVLVLREGRPPAVWYRVATLPLVFLRSETRCQQIVRACRSCPAKINLTRTDLTPPVPMGELLWLLLGVDPATDLGIDLTLHHESLLAANPRQVGLARKLVGDFEKAAWRRWRQWLRT